MRPWCVNPTFPAEVGQARSSLGDKMGKQHPGFQTLLLELQS